MCGIRKYSGYLRSNDPDAAFFVLFLIFRLYFHECPSAAFLCVYELDQTDAARQMQPAQMLDRLYAAVYFCFGCQQLDIPDGI